MVDKPFSLIGRRVRRIIFELPLDHSYGREMMRGACRYSWAEARDDWHITYILAPHCQRNGVAEFDGVIAGISTLPHAAMLQQSGVPVVNVAGIFETSFCPRVTWDNVQIGQTAGRHLLARRYTRVACIVPSGGRWFANQRLSGFQQVLAEAGICPVVFEECLDSQWLHQVDKPLAVFAVNDELGRAAIEQCQAAGIALPREAVVVGVNNDDLVCETIIPALSSIALPGEEVGYAAARVLDLLLAGETVPAETWLPPGPLVVRTSSDMYATNDPLLVQALEILRTSFDSSINVEQWVHLLRTSRATLERSSRREFGCTPLTLLQACRLDRAMALLSRTDWPLARIAERCGYATVSRLVEAFKRQQGMTPGTYRNTIKGGDGKT